MKRIVKYFRVIIGLLLFRNIFSLPKESPTKNIEKKIIQTGELNHDSIFHSSKQSSNNHHNDDNKYTQAGFVDCTSTCSFPKAVTIKANTISYYVALPSDFQVSFQYMVGSNPTANGVYANIFDIYSYDSSRSLLSLSLEPGSNQVRVDYNGTNKMAFGPPVAFHFLSSRHFKYQSQRIQ